MHLKAKPGLTIAFVGPQPIALSYPWSGWYWFNPWAE